MRSALQEVVSSQQTSDLFAALDELAEVSADAGRRMLLVVEDTDVFMPPTDVPGTDSRDRATRFITQVLPFLARELRCPSLIAVNSRYRDLTDRHLKGTTTDVEVPRFKDPADALVRIMQKQALRKGLHLDASILEAAALAFLAAALDGGASVRSVLRAIYDAAIRTAHDEPGSEQISIAAVMASL